MPVFFYFMNTYMTIPRKDWLELMKIVKEIKLKKEEWLSDGSLAAEFLLPAGAKGDLLNELNSATHGEIIIKIIGTAQ